MQICKKRRHYLAHKTMSFLWFFSGLVFSGYLERFYMKTVSSMDGSTRDYKMTINQSRRRADQGSDIGLGGGLRSYPRWPSWY